MTLTVDRQLWLKCFAGGMPLISRNLRSRDRGSQLCPCWRPARNAANSRPRTDRLPWSPGSSHNFPHAQRSGTLRPCHGSGGSQIRPIMSSRAALNRLPQSRTIRKTPESGKAPDILPPDSASSGGDFVGHWQRPGAQRVTPKHPATALPTLACPATFVSANL